MNHGGDHKNIYINYSGSKLFLEKFLDNKIKKNTGKTITLNVTIIDG